jgi:hypothetical protein
VIEVAVVGAINVECCWPRASWVVSLPGVNGWLAISFYFAYPVFNNCEFVLKKVCWFFVQEKIFSFEKVYFNRRTCQKFKVYLQTSFLSLSITSLALFLLISVTSLASTR